MEGVMWEAQHKDLENGGIFTNVIQLIHPSQEDVWICKGLKKDEETEVYIIYHDGKKKEIFTSLEEMNELVNGKYYTGRDLTNKDFGCTDV